MRERVIFHPSGHVEGLTGEAFRQAVRLWGHDAGEYTYETEQATPATDTQEQATGEQETGK